MRIVHDEAFSESLLDGYIDEPYRKIGFSELDIPSRNGESDVVMAMPLTQMGVKLEKYLMADTLR